MMATRGLVIRELYVVTQSGQVTLESSRRHASSPYINGGRAMRSALSTTLSAALPCGRRPSRCPRCSRATASVYWDLRIEFLCETGTACV